MKVLQLCLRIPYPPADGGTIAMYNMAMSLNENNCVVKIISFNTKKHFIPGDQIPSWFVEKFHPESVFLDASIKLLPALLNFFNNKSYNISRFDVPQFHDLIAGLLQKEHYDIIQLESLFVTPYLRTIRKFSSSPVVYRSHNMEYLIWERLAQSEKNPFKKWYLNFLTGRLKSYELSVLNKFNGILALTSEDEKIMQDNGCKLPLEIAPIGVDLKNYKAEDTQSPFSIFHLGSMDWLPNIEGVDWFIDHVLPELTARKLNFPIHLAGKSMPDRIFKLPFPSLNVLGRIDDARKFMTDKPVMIVPLLSGGGMRVKIIEGMAMGKTIISTSIGAEGINYMDGENILIANTAEEFVNHIQMCLTDPEFCSGIGVNARKLVEQKYNNHIIGSKVKSFYERLSQSLTTKAI